MSLTNFAKLTEEQKTVWAKDLWKHARNQSFISRFMGKGTNSIVQHVTDLKKTKKGARAVMTLLADLEGDGVAGDATLEGNEEALKTNDRVITIDQLRHANRNEGRMADQRSVVEFRSNSRDVLAYWLADRLDQLAFLTMSGVAYSKRNNGADRIGSDLINLDFASDVSAPTDARRVRWNGTTKNIEVGGATSDVTATDTPMWELFVQLKAYAQEQYIRPVRGDGGKETFHVFLSPTAMARLKLDPTYMQNVRNAQVRSSSNPLFSGTGIEIDGIVFHEFRHVYNTRGASAGNKWGAGGAVDGCNVLFCGAQALGIADIGTAEWVEKGFDYDNQQGISVGKICGMLKPSFKSIYDNNTVQDFGVISTYVAQ
jgi:N4-gp56 family major capsid protein